MHVLREILHEPGSFTVYIINILTYNNKYECAIYIIIIYTSADEYKP